MTAQILVVDDVPANVKLLEAKLASEYYDVLTAKDGFEALQVAKNKKPDLILLDVMMPGMDGFEVCRRLKQDSEISHIPVVMVTALSDQADRIRGLDAGADDFLTKPINDNALFARVKSLVRIKALLDELRMRDQTRAKLGIATENSFTADVSNSKILLIDDDGVQSKQLYNKLSTNYQVEVLEDPTNAVEQAASGGYDLIMVSTLLTDADGLRLATQMKNRDELRSVPIVTLVDEDDDRIMLKGLEIGINDYLRVPVDKNEMEARVRTNIRRKKYQEALKKTYQQSISMAITDGLTGLYNRHYLNTHLENLFNQAMANKRPLTLLILDMDHFKMVNDTYGHDAGDLCLKQLAKLMLDEARSSDLVARYGGEEFVILLPETDVAPIRDVADRLRKKIEALPFVINPTTGETIHKTVSIGVAGIHLDGMEDGKVDTPNDLLKRADTALYKAKTTGRNQVILAE
jgi:two-component system cell cycle response regulator